MTGLELFGNILGTIGMVIVCYSFYNITISKWESSDNIYLCTNILGAILLLISLCINFNLGSFIIEIVWISISLNGFYLNYKKQKGNM